MRVQSPGQHIIGHLKDDLPSQLNWCKNPVFPTDWLDATCKENQTATKLQHKKLTNSYKITTK